MHAISQHLEPSTTGSTKLQNLQKQMVGKLQAEVIQEHTAATSQHGTK